MQLIDHEADNFLLVLRDHADAVSLAEATQKVFFRPGKLKALMLNAQNIRHISTNQPTDLNRQFWLFLVTNGHDGLLAIFMTPILCANKGRDDIKEDLSGLDLFFAFLRRKKWRILQLVVEQASLRFVKTAAARDDGFLILQSSPAVEGQGGSEFDQRSRRCKRAARHRSARCGFRPCLQGRFHL